jgi:hypothetical protein
LNLRILPLSIGSVLVVAASIAASDHWAFQKLVPPPPFQLPDAEQIRTPVDLFVERELRVRGLTLSAEPDRATLLRRLSLDLLGLPSRPVEIEQFKADASPDAYERLVDRMLTSPHYGERWGKYWLDAAGYADSNGYFNADSDRPLAYRYRDYVIRALNRDLPFDQFIREQLAGDELAGFKPESDSSPRTIELLEATHYLRNGQDGSQESDGNPDEVRVDRYSALESAMQNTASSLLALTIQCAKCHDHKFEPISQLDYYRYQAILYPTFNIEQWIKPNDRIVLAPLPGQRDAWAARLKAAEAQAARLEADLANWSRTHRPRGDVLYEDTFDDAANQLAAAWSNTAPGDDSPSGEHPVTVDSNSAPGAIVADGHLKIVESGAGGSRWLATRQRFDWTPAEKGHAIQVTFDLIDNRLGGVGQPAERIGYYLALHDYSDNSPVTGGNILIDGNPGGSTSVHVDYPGADSNVAGEIGNTAYTPGRSYGVRVTNIGDNKFRLEHLVNGLAEEKSVSLTAAELPDGGFGWEYCCGRSYIVDNVRIERFAAAVGSAGSAEPAELAAALKEQRKPLEQARQTRDSLRQNPPGRISWATDMSGVAPDVFLLDRGSYAARTVKVEPAPPEVLSESNRPFDITPPPSGANTTGRRLALAQWLTTVDSRAAALAARVQVNRLWQNHFGVGIVATPENLGVSGARPTHPELLDWLAWEFVRSGLSFKTMHRRIVCSTTYRQASRGDASAIAADPEGRLLSRFPVRRLDADAIRDSMLAASGDLDERMFGPYIPTSRNAAGEIVVAANDSGGARRSIYLYQRRTQVLSLLAVFDAPSIVFNCLSRPRSTMPLQSLSLLNSEFVVGRAQHLAEGLLSDFPADESARLTASFTRVLGRSATDSELAAATSFVEAQLQTYGNDVAATRRAWQDLCQMLLASNAFLYLE